MPSGIELIGRGLEMAVAASPVVGGVVEEAAAAWGMQVLAIAKRRGGSRAIHASETPQGRAGRQYQRTKARPASREKGSGQKAKVGSLILPQILGSLPEVIRSCCHHHHHHHPTTTRGKVALTRAT
jgi:hypothetical protein